MDGLHLSDDELRGLTEGAGDPAPRASLFSPRDFADASRVAHRLFGRGVAGFASALGGAREPMPPEIRMTAGDAIRNAAERNPNLAFTLEFTGQFRASVALVLNGDPDDVPRVSSEHWTVLAENLAREAEVAFRTGLGRGVAIEAAPLAFGEDEPLLWIRGGDRPVALEFDLEAGRREPLSLGICMPASVVRDLASLVRPPEPATVKRAEPTAAAPSVPPATVPAREVRTVASSSEQPIAVAAEIGRCAMSPGELAALAIGQIIRLDSRAGEMAVLTAGGRIVASGEVVVSGGFLALEISGVAPRPEQAREVRP